MAPARSSNRRLRSGPAALAAGLLLSLAAAPAAAQEGANVARGFSAAGAFAVGDVDHVNLFNGNLVLTLPIGQRYPVGGGLAYGLTLTYNSKLWEYKEVLVAGSSYDQVQPLKGTNAGLGWTLSLGRLLPAGHAENTHGKWVYLAPDGSEHVFDTLLHNTGTVASNIFYTNDGSYLRLRSATREVELPDGTIHKFDTATRLVQIRDRSGNAMNVTYGPTTWTLADGHRTHTVHWKNATYFGTVVASVDLAGPEGTRSAWTFEHEDRTLVVGCPHTMTSPGPSVTVPLLTAVVLPDGTRYSMPAADYNVFTGSSCNSQSGLLRKLTLPTLGKLEWDYQTYTMPSSYGTRCREFFASSVGVSHRRQRHASGTVAGETVYQTSLEFPPLCKGNESQEPKLLTNTVVDPLGHKTERYFSVARVASGSWKKAEYGLQVSHYTNDGTSLARGLAERTRTATGTLLRTGYRRYEVDDPGGDRVNPRLASERTVFNDDGSRYADVDRSDFDGFGHYRTTTTGGSFGSGDVRSVATTYNAARGTYPGSWTNYPTSTAWVLGTWAERTVTEANVSARVEACFDQPTGRLLRERVLETGTTRGTDDLLAVYGYDAAGNVTSEKRYGGDNQTVSTVALCTLTPPTSAVAEIAHTYAYGARESSRNLAVAWKLLDLTIDAHTALPTSSRDSAGLSTTYDYDALGRPTWARPSGDGATNTVYAAASGTSTPAKVTIYHKNSAGTSNLAVEELHFDGFGRVIKERRKMPDGTWSDRTTSYDAAGNLSKVSSQGQTGSTTEWSGYDPFGRPGRIVPPAGAAHEVTIAYQGVRLRTVTTSVGTSRSVSGAITESDAETTETYDRQGRLWKVDEPLWSGSRPQTVYAYDVGGRLRQVTQGSQTRSFTYDNRGFLVSERHPEIGASGGGTLTYSKYDALGNPGQVVGGGWDLTTTYDGLGRPRTVAETSSGRLWKEWTYGVGTTSADRSAGKTRVAVRHNWLVPPGGSTEVDLTVTETYTWGGKGGRLSKKATAVNTGGISYEQTFTWNDLGDLASQVYPKCLHATCTATLSSAPSQSYTYTNGFLTAVPGYASAIAYHPNGLVARVDHTNGVVDTIANDPDGLPRPASISTTGGSRNFVSGTYAYDGTGNVVKMGTDWFLYDTLSRVVEGRVKDPDYDGGTEKKQAYTFDRYGNLLSAATTVGTGSAVTRTMPVVASTNRLSAGGYDAAGNLTTWAGSSYGYDPFGMLRYAPNRIFVYGPGDERIWSIEHSGATWTGETWSLRGVGGEVLRDFRVIGGNAAGNWSLERDWIYRGAALLASTKSATGYPYHYSLDHLGTPRLVTKSTTNSSGQAIKVAAHNYYPFGEESTSPTQDTERMKFTGHERDFMAAGTTDDLDYMHARYYGVQIGRFFSVDPVGGVPGQPQSWNRYGYVMGRSMVMVDPRGRLATFYGWIDVTASAWAFAPGASTGLQGLADLMAGFLLEYGAPEPTRVQELEAFFHRPEVIVFAACVQLAASGPRGADKEGAGFWIRTDDGSEFGQMAKMVDFGRRPDGRLYATLSLPAGAIANFHTHPSAGGGFRPGPEDLSVGKIMPVFVLHKPSGVTVYESNLPKDGVRIAAPGWDRSLATPTICDGFKR